MATLEQSVQQSIFSKDLEKTFVDKVLAKQEVDRMRDLVKKPKLKREELLELLYMVSGTEAKLLNFNDWDRYIILKFFVWLREFVKILEMFYDYREYLENKEKDEIIEISPRFRKILDNCHQLLEHNAKFLIDLYLNMGRTSLSVGAVGFFEILRNKFEIAYPQQSGVLEQEQSKGRIFGKSR